MIGKRRTYKQTTLSNEFFKRAKLSNDSDSKIKLFIKSPKEKEEALEIIQQLEEKDDEILVQIPPKTNQASVDGLKVNS